MLAAFGVTAPPWHLSRITFGTKASFCFAFKRNKPCFLIVPSLPRPRNFAGTTKKIGAIGIVAIAAPAALGLWALPQLLWSIQARPRLEINVTATGQRVKKIKTWSGLLVITVTRKNISLTNVPSFTTKKTSIGLGNLLVGEWCYYGDFKDERLGQDPLHVLPCSILQR